LVKLYAVNLQGINIDEIIAYKSEEKLRNLASILNLNAEALISLGQEFTPPRLPKEVTQITSSFGHLGVNAFYIETSFSLLTNIPITPPVFLISTLQLLLQEILNYWKNMNV